MMKRFLFLALALLLVGVLGWYFYKHQAPQEVAPPEAAPAKEEKIVKFSDQQIQDADIRIEEVQPGRLSLTLSARGKIILHPDRLAHIFPKVSGVAREAMKNIGDQVRQDDVLAIFESREMADIKANYLAAIEKEKLAWAFLEREKRLHDKKISAEQDYLNALSSYEEAKIHLQLAQQQLHAYGLTDKDIAILTQDPRPDLRGFAIRAPMSGTILSRHITRGEYIENATMIYQLADLSLVWVEIGIFPKDLSKVKEGQKVEITLPVDGEKTEAKIIYVSPIIQDETITSKAIAVMDNKEGKWRPGTFVKVNIDTERVAVPLAVPCEAVQEENGQSYLFVRVSEGFEKRFVRTGKCDVGQVEILEGIQQGEKYAAANTFILKAELGKSEVEDDD